MTAVIEKITRGVSRVLGIEPPDEDFLAHDSGPILGEDEQQRLDLQLPR